MNASLGKFSIIYFESRLLRYKVSMSPAKRSKFRLKRDAYLHRPLNEHRNIIPSTGVKIVFIFRKSLPFNNVGVAHDNRMNFWMSI